MRPAADTSRPTSPVPAADRASGNEHDLAVGAGLEYGLLRGGGVGELELAADDAFHSARPVMLASLPMVPRGLISMLPRLPMITMRPKRATTSMSFWRFTLASISRMTSGPLPPV